MDCKKDRRDFIKHSLLAPAAAAAALTMGGAQRAYAQAAAPAPAPSASTSTLPTGKIGDMTVSRMLLGGNLLTHFTHSRDLQYVYNLCAQYNTDEKIMETMAVAEQNGINTLSIHTVPRALATMQKHRNNGGKMQWIICPTAPVEAGMEKYRQAVRELVDNGTDAIYLWGVHSDSLIGKEQGIDLLGQAVDVAKEMGVPSGVGAHSLDVVRQCEAAGVRNDFYIKTFHHHNYATAPRPEQIKGPHSEIPGYWCANPQETIDVMSKVEKPWIAFKIMAAGAIKPEDAFQFTFDNGADHALVGMFDFEIAQDAALMAKVLQNVNRTRPWRS